ncbi:MAG: endonuclease domain-containing protein [Chthonomonadetes bacterium]|nr:endonuclease domain-containing protein [Chthonomonadetes bacterium]
MDAENRPVWRLPDYILQLCRDFRHQPTPAEQFLWECLRARRLNGLKFRRQHAIGRYIVDFYCHERRLIVELEGDVHSTSEQQVYDAMRFADLEAQGYRVLRFRNEDLLRNPEAVLACIAEAW